MSGSSLNSNFVYVNPLQTDIRVLRASVIIGLYR